MVKVFAAPHMSLGSGNHTTVSSGGIHMYATLSKKRVVSTLLALLAALALVAGVSATSANAAYPPKITNVTKKVTHTYSKVKSVKAPGIKKRSSHTTTIAGKAAKGAKVKITVTGPKGVKKYTKTVTVSKKGKFSLKYTKATKKGKYTVKITYVKKTTTSVKKTKTTKTTTHTTYKSPKTYTKTFKKTK